MSSGNPSKKEKRPRISTDDKSSFISNVASKVTGLLPSTIANWFGRHSSSTSNGSASVAESSDSSTEDELINSPPPPKRMRYSPPISTSTPETKCAGTNTEAIATFSGVNSSSSRSRVKVKSETILKAYQSPNEETTSDNNKDTAKYNLQNSYSSADFKSIVRKRKSLFDRPGEEKTFDKPPQPYLLLDLSQPYHKPGIFGSPFYPGKTRYGGASSSYMNQPNIQLRKDTLLSQSPKNDNLTNSHATRRVMDLLENYSSPLIEAKRISQFTRSNSLDSTRNSDAYKTQELHVPSIAQILRLKKKSRLMDTTSAARQIIASNSSSAFTPYPTTKSRRNNLIEKSEKMTSKMKNKITRINRDDTTVSEVNESTPVHLPTAVLQIDKNNLPKFTLGTSASSSVSTTKTWVQTTVNANKSSRTAICTANTTSTINTGPIFATKLNKREPVSKEPTEIASKPKTSENSFKFSRPVMIQVQTAENSSGVSSYTFDSPKLRKNEVSKDKESLFVANTKSEAQAETWKCADCWVSNKSASEKCVCCGAKKPVSSENKTKHCSVCKVVLSGLRLDKCIACEKKADNVATIITGASKWKCQDCEFNNDEDVDECVCCGDKKYQGKIPIAIAKSDDLACEWKCEDCWIKNKSSADKCAACGRAKPTATQKGAKKSLLKPSIPKTQASNDSTFKNIIKIQSDKWECSNCLVHNDKDRSKCLCCDTENLSKIKNSEKNCFNFSKTQNTAFKFGIDPNKNNSDRKVESQLDNTIKEETNNNIVMKPQSFTFGINKQRISDKINKEETKSEEASKPAFKFGVSKPVVSTAPAISNFFKPIEISSKVPQVTQPNNTIETDEKVQEVPNIEEEPNITEPQNTQKLVGFFGIPLNTTSASTTTAPALVSFGQDGQNTNTQTLPSTITTAVDAKVAQSNFTFSVSSNKPGLNLFSSVTTASTTTTIQAPSTSSTMFVKSAPVQTSSLNFFAKSDQRPSASTLFNSNEKPMTTATPSPLSSAPVFSFSTNTQEMKTEKPQFSFKFGNNSEPNLFNLPTSNTGNVLQGNGLSSANTTASIIVAGGNGLASSTVTGTSLSSGLLVGSKDAKKDNIMWSSNQMDSVKMSSGNNAASSIQSNNPFSVQTKKDNTWSLNQLTSSELPAGNNVDPANNTLGVPSGGMFGTTEKKENMWTMSNNNSTMFTANAGTNSMQKPATFSFGSSMQFDSNNITPTPTFGSLAQPAQNIFGMSSQVNNNQSDMFSSSLQNQTSPNMFGAQAVNNNTPSVGMFGTINSGSTQQFGPSNPSLPTFEAAAPLNPVPAPNFNFGAQQTTGVFGFGQQQAQTQGGVYNFGAQTASPQRQFNIGTAGGTPNAMGRRPIRRAVRRSNQR